MAKKVKKVEIQESTDSECKTEERNAGGTRCAVSILTAAIHESPYQTRRDCGDLDGLAQSIRQHGLINPVTVRQMDGTDDWEMIAGHRRLAAVRLAGLEEIAAVVIACDDRTAAEMCVAENMQRQDLTPLEEAAGVAALLDTGHTAQDVADRLGRSRKWVERRRRLLSLTEAAKEACANPDCSFSRLPVEALEMIAALPDEAQGAIVGLYKSRCVIAPTAAAVRNHIEQYVMRDLARARFDTGDCKKCQARTGCQPDMFDGGETCELGRCLNPECFTNKRDAAIKAVADELRFDDPKVKILCDDYHVRDLAGAKPVYEFQKCKKGERGAEQAYLMDSEGAVKTCWIRAKAGTPGGDDDGGPRVAQPTDEQKRRSKVCEAMQKKLAGTIGKSGKAKEGHPFFLMDPIDVLRVIAVAGTIERYQYARPTSWEAREDFKNVLWEAVEPVLYKRLNFDAIIRCDSAYLEAVEMGRRLFGMEQDEVDALWGENGKAGGGKKGER